MTDAPREPGTPAELSALGGRDRRPTMADIARHVGVSRPLVSIVLRGVEGASDETRRRVLEAATELGYRPDSLAQRLRSNRTRLLGVLFEIRRAFEIEFVEHMFPVVSELGYHLLLGAKTPHRSQDAVADELLSYKCEGLVVIGPELRGTSLEAIAVEVPIVEVGRSVTGGVDVVRNDDAAGTRQAVDHLVGLGHRSITFVDGGQNPGAKGRRAGYRAAMRRHGLQEEAHVVPGGHAEEEGAKAAQTILAGPLPTAVMTSNDRAAIGLLDTFVRAGVRIPEDVSVVGYDDSRLARLPGIDLTSVRQDIPKMAELAVRTLIDRLDRGPFEPKDLTTTPHLVIRGTTGAPRSTP